MNQLLNRITVESENSVYFSGKIKVDGITEADETVSLEFPIYLNVLPNIPHVSFVDLIDIGEYDPMFNDYYDATMLGRFSIDRTDRYKVTVNIGAPVMSVYYIDFNDKISDKEFQLEEYSTKYHFVAINQFGSVKNDSIFNFNEEALEALGRVVSVEDELAEDNTLIIYPNPVKDNLYITGKP